MLFSAPLAYSYCLDSQADLQYTCCGIPLADTLALSEHYATAHVISLDVSPPPSSSSSSSASSSTSASASASTPAILAPQPQQPFANCAFPSLAAPLRPPAPIHVQAAPLRPAAWSHTTTTTTMSALPMSVPGTPDSAPPDTPADAAFPPLPLPVPVPDAVFAYSPPDALYAPVWATAPPPTQVQSYNVGYNKHPFAHHIAQQQQQQQLQYQQQLQQQQQQQQQRRPAPYPTPSHHSHSHAHAHAHGHAHHHSVSVVQQHYRQRTISEPMPQQPIAADGSFAKHEPADSPSPGGGAGGRAAGKPFPCPNAACSKSYKQAAGLKYHLTTGTCDAGPATVLPCSVCGREFRQMARLRAHARTHGVAL